MGALLQPPASSVAAKALGYEPGEPSPATSSGRKESVGLSNRRGGEGLSRVLLSHHAPCGSTPGEGHSPVLSVVLKRV